MSKRIKQSKVSFKQYLCVSTMILGIITFTSMRVNSTINFNNSPSYSSLTPHNPIFITYDSNFTDYGFTGAGTEFDPYLIEGYNITTTEDNGIYISDTTKYFTVRNCYVDALENGIFIDNVVKVTATVINNICSYNSLTGIFLRYSGNSTVDNNTCNDNYVGIELHFSCNSTVTKNMCENNNNMGIWVTSSDGSTVINNTCSNHQYGSGIVLNSSDNTTVVNNICNNNRDGIYLLYSGNSTVDDNICNNNEVAGINVYDSYGSVVSNNTMINCGLLTNELTLDAHLSYTVYNNLVNGKQLGFYTNLDSTIIDEPIYGQLVLINCTDITVRDQILNNVTTGLFFYSCPYSVTINNTCSGNNRNGIYLRFSDYSTTTNNTCNNNDDEGVFLYVSDFCIISYNLLQENGKYGVYLLSNSDNNTFHHNTFTDNNLGGSSQAYDGGDNNTWYDTTTLEGNFWNDWSGTGSYAIDGSPGTVDLYPLGDPVVAEYNSPSLFTLLILVVPLLLTVVITLKRRR